MKTGRSTHRAVDAGLAHWLILGLLLVPVRGGADEPAALPHAADQTTTAQPQAPAAPDAVAAQPSASPPLAQPVTSRAELKAMVDQSARDHGLDRDLVHALIRAESAYNPQAVSPAGAVGLMQVMPGTAADYGVNAPAALFEPATNLNTGMRHFKRLLDKYGSIASAVMAYNAGEGALERGGGFVAYAETQRYTHQVLMAYLGSKGIAPYSSQAREATGIDLTPAMANAVGGSGSGVGVRGNPLETYQPAPDQVWQSTVTRPALNTELSAQLRDKPGRLSSRLSATASLKVSSLRMTPPGYAIQPTSVVVTRHR